MPLLSYLGAEVFKRVTLDGVDAELGAGLDSCEASGDCVIFGQLVHVVGEAIPLKKVDSPEEGGI